MTRPAETLSASRPGMPYPKRGAKGDDMRTVRSILVAVLLALPIGVGLAEEAKPERQGVHALTSDELEKLFRGHSFSGYHFGSGRRFSEYHHADGRVIGNNGISINTDGCWYVREGAICYVYGPPKDRRTYCFVMHRTGASRTMTLTVLPDKRLVGIGILEEGNPHNLTPPNDWTCEAPIARAPMTPRPTALARAVRRDR
jgi:hypothetical protein